jgi:hypothetical protein
LDKEGPLDMEAAGIISGRAVNQFGRLTLPSTFAMQEQSIMSSNMYSKFQVSHFTLNVDEVDTDMLQRLQVSIDSDDIQMI